MSTAAPPPAGTPLAWRVGPAAVVALLVAAAYLLRDVVPPHARAVFGIPAFIGLAAVFSTDLRRVNWRTVAAGFALQVVLAVLILKVPVVYAGFELVGQAIKKFLDFTDEGTQFLFGPLAVPGPSADAIGGVGGGPAVPIAQKSGVSRPFLFAFKALPAVIFVSSFFTVLYYLGVLQFVVRLFARLMVWVMGTSGAETLSAVANVFMGQTEAPLIVKPYVPRMTRSELLALMVGGMATISGGVMVAYIAMGANPVAILATSVMAAPAGLYLSKILVPETEVPQTRGAVTANVETTHANVFDAAADGASEGMKLVLNIAAMLIAFIAFIALFNHLLGKIEPGLTLQFLFAKAFGPVAYLMGVSDQDVPAVGELLGVKLALNEFVAYTLYVDKAPEMADRSKQLAVFALTGFANFASIGIQLGGIGALPKDPADQAALRARLAKLGGRALLGGFLATVVNASVAGLLIE